MSREANKVLARRICHNNRHLDRSHPGQSGCRKLGGLGSSRLLSAAGTHSPVVGEGRQLRRVTCTPQIYRDVRLLYDHRNHTANPNLKFMRYWGNRDHTLRLPMNLDGLYTRTMVSFQPSLPFDELIIV